MKQILEVGDRVKLVNALFSPTYIGTTGTVTYVSDEPHENGTYTVRYVLDQAAEMGKQLGFTVIGSSADMKYLKPKKPKQAKDDKNLAKWIDSKTQMVRQGKEYSGTTGSLAYSLHEALDALRVVAEMENLTAVTSGEYAKVTVLELKRMILEKLEVPK